MGDSLNGLRLDPSSTAFWAQEICPELETNGTSLGAPELSAACGASAHSGDRMTVAGISIGLVSIFVFQIPQLFSLVSSSQSRLRGTPRNTRQENDSAML